MRLSHSLFYDSVKMDVLCFYNSVQKSNTLRIGNHDDIVRRFFSVCQYNSLSNIVWRWCTAIRRLRKVYIRCWARLKVQWRGQWHGLVANHLTRAQVLQIYVNGTRSGTYRALKLNLRGLTSVTNFILATWLVMFARAVRSWSRLTTQIVFEVYNISLNLRDGSATDNSEFHTTLIAIFVLDGVQRVGEWSCTLVKFFFVCTCIITEAI